jgi:CO dehydrogenase maturation factor
MFYRRKDRDFIVKGEQVTLIDIEAGLEHFGRGVERNIDIVLIVSDPTFESFLIAEKVDKLCRAMGTKKVWSILNKVQSEEMESLMVKELKKRKVKILGSVYDDPALIKASLSGTPLDGCKAIEDIRRIVERLEEMI